MDEGQLADAFTEWKTRYDTDPDSFQGCAAFEKEPPRTYGDGAARYFLWLIEDMQTNRWPHKEEA